MRFIISWKEVAFPELPVDNFIREGINEETIKLNGLGYYVTLHGSFVLPG